MRYELFCDVGPDMLLPDPGKVDVLFTTNPGPRPKDGKRLKLILEWPPRPGTKHASQVAQATQTVAEVGEVDVEIEQNAPQGAYRVPHRRTGRPMGRPRKIVDAVAPAKAGGVGKMTFASVDGGSRITVDASTIDGAMKADGLMGSGKEFKYDKDRKLKS